MHIRLDTSLSWSGCRADVSAGHGELLQRPLVPGTGEAGRLPRRLLLIVATNSDRQYGLVQRGVRLVEALRNLATRPAVRPWLLGFAALAFLGMAYLSFRQLDDVGRSAEPLVLLPYILLAVPASLLLNALEYRAMAESLGHRMGVRSAAKVSLAATLANYLPAPGGIAVRTAALKGRGSSFGSAVSVNAVAGVLWLGIAAVATGAALLASASLTGRGLLAAGGGLVATVAAALWARRGRQNWWPSFRRLLLIETGIVVVAGLRIWLALQAIGQAASVGAALAISSSTVIAAAVGIFPAGLGLREIIGGGLAVAVDVPAATAIAALSVDRVAGPVGTALCAPFVGLRRRERSEGKAGDETAATAAGSSLETHDHALHQGSARRVQ